MAEQSDIEVVRAWCEEAQTSGWHDSDTMAIARMVLETLMLPYPVDRCSEALARCAKQIREGGVRMSNEERWEFLLAASKRVLRAFRRGDNPTFDQVDRLESAVECIDGLKICGHRHIEECECLAQMKR